MTTRECVLWMERAVLKTQNYRVIINYTSFGYDCFFDNTLYLKMKKLGEIILIIMCSVLGND